MLYQKEIQQLFSYCNIRTWNLWIILFNSSREHSFDFSELSDGLVFYAEHGSKTVHSWTKVYRILFR